MHLVVKKNGVTVSEFKSSGEPIRIGRRADNQIVLDDPKTSKHHALVFAADNGKWMVEDLKSANKTYLNDEPVQKSELKSGDKLRISDFIIEIHLEEQAAAKSAFAKQVGLGSVSVTAGRDQQLVVRKIGADKSPAVTLAAQRLVDYLQATDLIDKTNSLEELVSVLLEIVAKQFHPYHSWCALRKQPLGPLDLQKGRQRDGLPIELKNILIGDKTNQSIEKNEFLLFIFSRDLTVEKDKQVRSTIIAPVMNSNGCFGVIYANNTFRQDHYNLADMDYLMFIAIHAANKINKF